jgi:uncharacterized protein (DUF427 family)
MRPKPIKPSEGQESVWDYPRPPALEPVSQRLRVVHGGQVVADTANGFRVLETSHPPVYYFPPMDCRMEWLQSSVGSSFCEWKGMASYVDLSMPETDSIPQVAWQYPNPSKRFADLAGYLAFYCHKVDACFVGDEKATPQPGDFYGGWVTTNIAGPIKGIPGSQGW